MRDFIDINEKIEELILDLNLDPIDAALKLADDLDMEPEHLAPYISGAMKEKIRLQGTSMGLLKRTESPMVTFS